MSKILIIVGSAGRGDTNPNDIDMITTENLNDFTKDTINMFGEKNVRIIKDGDKFKQLQVKFQGKNMKFDIWKTTNNNLIYSILNHLLPRNKIIGLKKIAKEKGLKLTSNGLYRNNRKLSTIKTLDMILDTLDIKNRDNIEHLFNNITALIKNE